MKDIMLQTVRASEKIEAIRQFSKPGQIKLQAVELGKIVQNSLSLLDHLLRTTHVTVKTHFVEAIAPIRGDAKQLEIVFVNLIKNAAEAMSTNPGPALARLLVLTGREEGDWIVTTVKDTGPGMKSTDVGHLFNAYFTTKGSEGTGMGLFLSQQVIKAHGGTIDVTSEEGRGTEFIIRLPKFAGEATNSVHQAA
jgi:signal transduction histidine kinase